MICWNPGCNTDIVKGENWTPINKIWIETATDRPHNFRKCFVKNPSKSKYKKTGDPIIDNANLTNYYKDLGYFLKHGPPKHGYYDLSWLEKK